MCGYELVEFGVRPVFDAWKSVIGACTLDLGLSPPLCRLGVNQCLAL